MTIVLGRRIPRWPTPVHPSVVGLGGKIYGVAGSELPWPAFSNDDNAGSTITIASNTWTAVMKYYNGSDGAQITSGAWAGGLTVADFSASYWMGLYMDAGDALLYIWHWTQSSTSMRLSSINKAGQIVNYGAGISAPTSINMYDCSGFHRAVDGSGSFYGYTYNGNLNGNAAAARPYRGVRIEIHPTTGAHTYSYVTPAPGGLQPPPAISSRAMIGPTSNNIVMGMPGYANANDFGGYHAFLMNCTTGNEVANYIPTFEHSLGLPRSSGATFSASCERWGANYAFRNYSGGDNAGGRLFDVIEMHKYVDEIAREVGIL
mgnify:FL=1